MRYRKYAQEIFALVEIMIALAVIALLLASTVPGFLRARKRSQTSKTVIFARSANSLATV
jgi:type II secretory pathway pseudopilin PulG